MANDHGKSVRRVLVLLACIVVLIVRPCFLCAQSLKYQSDTIHVVNVDTLVVHDTIVSYIKINLPVSACFLSNINQAQYWGTTLGAEVNLVRNKFYGGIGLNWSTLNGPQFYNSYYTTFINQRDTTFNLQQVVNGDTVSTPIQTQYKYLDSTLNTVKTTNKYQLLQIPLVIGYVYDQGRWSLLNGIGANVQIYTPLPSTNRIVSQGSEDDEKNFLRPINIEMILQSQTLYYLNDQLSLGLRIEACYSPFSIYKTDFGSSVRRFTMNAGIQISYIL